MNTLTVKDIKDRLQEVKDAQDPFIAQCENDPRKSVQTLVEQWLKKQAKEKALKEQWVNMTSYERLARNKGFRLIAGVDEVGRGPLAGPVVASAVILPEECEILGLTDSKKLSEKKREEYYELIMKEALAVGIGIVEATVIDEINIYEASKMAMVKAIQNLSDTPDYLLVDAMTLPLDTAQASIIKGDAKSVSIAAGACIAKVTRDRMMSAYAETYPMYGFEKNKGYGTKEHLEALAAYGPTELHRKTFAPVQSFR
ncbi:ribonuclease HII [Bacillus subtilis]|uniref:ribonuclease HII n=1 Tax=Bacillus subtilis TaxID=1423 RepID=UPI00227DEE21|nr:ribonuclease HII [Bacillus subtilis]MCY8928524.1 ribonuclease HII [Bacillus subtilis]